ncbi:MAG TPA: YdeI/OmpD-associated family protein, partial [Thermoanaerobaculia bacterium]|nr:YdeI/OmpD-associated family protein [Thermoanaerobaculia bacterium]
LKKNKAASATFEKFPPGARREYIEWITDAKQDATRKKRLDTTIEWLAEGKRRNWKYENC